MLNDSEQADVEFLARECVAAGRRRPIGDFRRMLHGLLILADGVDLQPIEDVRHVYSRICDIDAQLELIATGQLRLPLDGKEPR